MNKSEIAKIVNCSRTCVMLTLKGKRNPKSETGSRIVAVASEMYASKCKQEFINNVTKLYNLKKTIDKTTKDLLNEIENHKIKVL